MLSAKRLGSLAALVLVAVSADAQTITNAAPPVLGFLDISAIGGTPITGVGDDTEHLITTTKGNAIFPPGEVLVSSNGLVAAGHFPFGGNVGFTNQQIPSLAGLPSNTPGGSFAILAPFWDDLDATAAPDTTIYWLESPNFLIVMWKDIGLFKQAGTGSFELQVFTSPGCGPSVQFVYQDVVFSGFPHDGGESATIGYGANQLGIANATWSFNNAAAVADGTVLTIDLPQSQLTATSPIGPGSLVLSYTATPCSGPFTSYVLAVAIHPSTSNLLFFGLDIPLIEVLSELASGFPYVGPLNGIGGFLYGPFVGLPPFTFGAVVVGFNNGALAGQSNTIRHTIP